MNRERPEGRPNSGRTLVNCPNPTPASGEEEIIRPALSKSSHRRLKERSPQRREEWNPDSREVRPPARDTQAVRDREATTAAKPTPKPNQRLRAASQTKTTLRIPPRTLGCGKVP